MVLVHGIGVRIPVWEPSKAFINLMSVLLCLKIDLSIRDEKLIDPNPFCGDGESLPADRQACLGTRKSISFEVFFLC